MAVGLSPKLPLTFGDEANYTLTQDLVELVQQNLKNLILTAPGERIMDPAFGVGLRNFLFEPNANATYSDITARVHNQVAKYMSFIEIFDIRFDADEVDGHSLYITIDYNIIPLAQEDSLSVLAAS